MTRAEKTKLNEIKRRYQGLKTESAEDVKQNRFTKMPLGDVVSEALWLVNQLEKATKGAPVEEEEETGATA